MNILILGASGFLGSKLTHLLLQSDFHIHVAGRDVQALGLEFPQAKVAYCDFLQDKDCKTWLPRLKGIEILINCVGIFHHPDKQKIWDIHFHAPRALYQAAEQIKIKQIIHVSALGIDTYKNDYADSKRAIEDYLKSLRLAHVILRPSFIYGPGSKGGMGLIRSLASFPGFTPLPGNGEQKFQPIYVGDLVCAIKNLITTKDPKEALTLAAISAETISFKKIIAEVRLWLGFKKSVFIKIPMRFIHLLASLGQVMGLSFINKSAIDMLERGNYSSQKEARLFQDKCKIIPIDFKRGLYLNKASRQDRWYPRLQMIRPILRLSLALIWLLSALTSVLANTTGASYQLLSEVGIPFHLQAIVLYGASIFNALIGLGLLFNFKIKCNCVLQLMLITIYTVIISWKLPYLWLEPFGPVVKNIPIMISICVLYVLESQ